MKTMIRTLLAGILFLLVVPLAVGLLLGDGGLAGSLEEGQAKLGLTGISFANKVELPETIDVWIEEEEKTVSVDFEAYVSRVVASEMPSAFELEALKAQSVAARTFAAAKIEKYQQKKPEAHPDAPVCNTTHCQVYKTEKGLIASHEDGWEEEGWKKIQKACKATKGELLYYDGEMVMQPLFFSSSGGQTENSEDVFVGAYPYLVSVSSPYEEKATHQNEETTFTLKEMKEKLQAAFPNKDFGSVTQDKIKILSRTAGGRVAQIQIGDGADSKLKGTEVRTGLGLSSTLFSISFAEGEGWNSSSPSKTKITFTSNGSGHGVGLSQYGADGMAKEGYKYKEILQHYYSGTEVY
ncbi:MAG: stage II sporulation protein D [Firmicutes bacterium]|nr:stage II sporulation protein D [Bacillota bacterium]